MKTLITALAVVAMATTAGAATTTTQTKTTTTTTAKPALHHKKHDYKHTAQKTTSTSVATAAGYREIHIGDPTVVYHEIGTAGAQRDNTIVPFYGEPIQSVKPYEIRYDYSI